MPEADTPAATDDGTNTPAPGTETGTDTGTEPTGDALEALKTLAEDLGLTPDQVKGRLEASRKWEKRAKDNAAAAQRLTELERQSAATRPEAEQIAEARIRAVGAELQLKRYEVAADMKLPASVAGLIAGDDEDAMRASAEDLIAFAKTYTKTAAPDLKQGTRGTRPDPQGDPDAWFRSLRGRRS